MSQSEAESVRLVVWDLDETFWRGTLSEGGIAWVDANAAIVVELARRGIISAICSKNDLSAVEHVLTEHGVREYFVFLSVDWSAKGPRLAALVEAVQLRAPTVLFIDDNALNRAEALHCVPGLQVAAETIVPNLLEDSRLRGKPDLDLKRLEQYRLLERRQLEQSVAGADTTAFLRASAISVSFEFDVAAHLDRAVELINRTNQLNYTKSRLPEDSADARAALMHVISRHTVTAALVQVRDRYGDYGFCGLYVLENRLQSVRPELLQFAFSCRVLGMGIENWLYAHLQFPQIDINGPISVELRDGGPTIDWVTLERPGSMQQSGAGAAVLSSVLLRGGCDMRALAHYFGMVSRRVVEEAAVMRDGQTALACSSILAVHAVNGVARNFVQDCEALGYREEDFRSLIADTATDGPAPGERAAWLFNFTIEEPVPVLRHLETGCLIPAWLRGIKGPPRRMLKVPAEESGLDPELLAHLQARFEMVGALPDAIFEENLRLILREAVRCGLGTRLGVFIILGNESRLLPDGKPAVHEPILQRNRLVERVVRDVPGVRLLAPGDFMEGEALPHSSDMQHFDRLVYFRMFQHVMKEMEFLMMDAA